MQQSLDCSSATSSSWRSSCAWRSARILPKHQIGAAGEKKEGRITVRPRQGRETAARQRAYPREVGAILLLDAER